MAQNKAQGEYLVVGDFLSYDPYGVMFRKDDAPLAALVNDTFRQLAEDHEIERRYTRWFLKKLPSGVSLDLPMSPQLETSSRCWRRRASRRGCSVAVGPLDLGAQAVQLARAAVRAPRPRLTPAA